MSVRSPTLPPPDVSLPDLGFRSLTNEQAEQRDSSAVHN
jgi:hypothetical protein